MKFDRGFIKWQPFNSVISTSSVMKNLKKDEVVKKPNLFPEEQEHIMNIIRDSYYSKTKIKISFYEKNHIETIETTIAKMNTCLDTIELGNHHTISFNQIIHISVD